MNDNVSYLSPAGTADLAPLLTASSAFSTVWQQGTLKFSSQIQDNLERHMRLFDGARQQLARDAQRLVAELSGDPLSRVLRVLKGGFNEEVIGVAEITRGSVVSRLQQLSTRLAQDRRSFDALPSLEAQTDRQRLLNRQKNSAATERQLREEHERESARAESLIQAIATLEANGLQTRFGGVVPSAADLQKLAVPGGEAVVAAEAIGKALEDLKVLLGDLVEGMRYAQLQRERREVQERVNDYARQLRELGLEQAQVQRNLSALDELPRLIELSQGWGRGVDVLNHSLQAQQRTIANQALATEGDVEALVPVFSALLAFLRDLLAQDRRAF